MLAGLLTGCADPVSQLSEVYYRGPGERVLCAVSIDRKSTDLASIATGLDRARDDGLVVQLYGHIPDVTVPVATLEAILAGARERGLDSFTYDDFAAGVPAAPGLALSFDDAAIEAWASIADLLDRYQTRVTFFVTRYHLFSDAQRGLLRDLADRGHAIAGHSVNHLRAPDYAEYHGLAGYLVDEVRPGIDALRADGHAPVAFAYPYGARTRELDRTLLEEVAIVRAVSFSRDGLLVSDPCPD